MTPRKYETSPRVREFGKRLQELALAEVDRRGRQQSIADIATALSMLPIGVEMLLDRGPWPLDTAICITEVLGVDVRLETPAAAA